MFLRLVYPVRRTWCWRGGCRASGSGVGGVRGDAGGVGAAAADPVPEGPRRSSRGPSLVRRFAAFTGPVPVAVGAGGGRGVLRSLHAAAPGHGVDGAALPELAADVLRLHHRCPLRVGGTVRGSGSGGAVRRSCTSGTRSPTSTEYEGRPGRRPLTYDEVQALFDAADGRVEEIRGAGPQGRADRDAGRGAAQDCLRVRAAPARKRAAWTWPTCAAIRRRRSSAGTGRCSSAGASRRSGSPPKRRTVLTVPEMDWVVEVLDQ